MKDSQGFKLRRHQNNRSLSQHQNRQNRTLGKKYNHHKQQAPNREFRFVPY
jgi:hypothetical protein